MKLLDLLKNPPKEYSPVPFWFLNGDLNRAEIERQLRDFCDHGVYGVVLHPRIGLPERIGYLSDTFFEAIGDALQAAEQLGMRVVLYDEGMYPSGSACGQVVAGHPELASRGIALADAPAVGDAVLCETEGKYLVERFSGGTLRGIHFGEDDGEANQPKSADILNPEAVERFIALTHEAYYARFARYFGKTVIGFFTDEPSILGRNVQGMFPWTRGFAAMFQAAGGNLAGLAALFSGQENADTALYHRLILQREGDVYYARLSNWCRKHGIALMGHPHQSDDIEVQRFFGVPGQDLVFRWVAPETGGTAGMDSTMAKCSADMARHMGCRRNSNECFGACNRQNNPWHFTGGDMKWYIDWLTVRGVNLLIPHAFYYSLEGPRSGERPPDVGPGSIWWPHYRLWADYMARLCALMAKGEYRADIAVLCRNRDLHAEAVAPLFQTQKSFEYLPESLWADCKEKKGQLICGKRVYHAVIGPAEQFASVPHTAEEIAPDVLCDAPQPDLRVASLTCQGAPCWLLVNEGETPIETRITFPTVQPLGQYDLWNDRAYRLDAASAIRLERRESLLVFACSAKEWKALPDALRIPAVSPRFSLEREEPEAIRKVYTAQLPPQAGDCLLTVEAEEMAELYVNGVLCGAAFWPPQRFVIPHALTGGEAAHLELRVTGSLANRYGRPVPFGLKLDENG